VSWRGLSIPADAVTTGFMIKVMADTAATILIVEDDAVIRRLVSEVLRHEGFTVEAAEGAVEMDAILARPGRSW